LNAAAPEKYTEPGFFPHRGAQFSPASCRVDRGPAFADLQRDAAEWIIRKGGRVMINGSREPLSRLGESPGGSFDVTGVDLTGTVLDPKELDHIAGLEHVRELYPVRRQKSMLACNQQLAIHIVGTAGLRYDVLRV
jgi:hypothetical protein